MNGGTPMPHGGNSLMDSGKWAIFSLDQHGEGLGHLVEQGLGIFRKGLSYRQAKSSEGSKVI